jgi:hypothetical protein
MEDHQKGIRETRTNVTRLTPHAAFTGEMTRARVDPCTARS